MEPSAAARQLPPLPPRIYDEAMSFSDTVFLFFLALVLFGPKKLPEMARQAGRLLAELRRASNEFKSQIETEIAHLETEKKQQAVTVLPPSPAPEGTVASLSASPAVAESISQQPESSATLAAPTLDAVAASPNLTGEAASSSPTEAVADTTTATSQESHV